MLAVEMLEIKISQCFSFFSTDCLKNNSEGLSNSTEEFLDLFNKSLTCFEHNLQVSYAVYLREALNPLNATEILFMLNKLQMQTRQINCC